MDDFTVWRATSCEALGGGGEDGGGAGEAAVEVARWDANPRVFFLRFKSAAAGHYHNFTFPTST